MVVNIVQKYTQYVIECNQIQRNKIMEISFNTYSKLIPNLFKLKKQAIKLLFIHKNIQQLQIQQYFFIENFSTKFYNSRSLQKLMKQHFSLRKSPSQTNIHIYTKNIQKNIKIYEKKIMFEFFSNKHYEKKINHYEKNVCGFDLFETLSQQHKMKSIRKKKAMKILIKQIFSINIEMMMMTLLQSYQNLYLIYIRYKKINALIIYLINIINMFIEQNKNSISIPVKIQATDEQDKKIIGKWSNDENLRYLAFIFYHRRKFQSKKQRKQLKMFHRLGQFVGQRTPLQTRSHHQKMIVRFRNVKGIIRGLKIELGQENFKQINKSLKSELEYWKPNRAYETNEKASSVEISCQTDLSLIKNTNELDTIQDPRYMQKYMNFFQQQTPLYFFPYYPSFYGLQNLN